MRTSEESITPILQLQIKAKTSRTINPALSSLRCTHSLSITLRQANPPRSLKISSCLSSLISWKSQRTKHTKAIAFSVSSFLNFCFQENRRITHSPPFARYLVSLGQGLIWIVLQTKEREWLKSDLNWRNSLIQSSVLRRWRWRRQCDRHEE